MRGVSRDIVLPATYLGLATDPWGHQRIGFEADLTLNRKDWVVLERDARNRRSPCWRQRSYLTFNSGSSELMTAQLDDPRIRSWFAGGACRDDRNVPV